MIDDMMEGGIALWILVIVVIGIVVSVLTNRSDQRRPSKPGETPLDIVQKRYARGEITQEECEQMTHDLSN